MTVKEMIVELENVEDKDQEVKIVQGEQRTGIMNTLDLTDMDNLTTSNVSWVTV